MPWRSITLVPFQRRGEFSGGNTSEENSDIEFVSERHAGPLQFSGMSSDGRETHFGDFVSDANSVAHSNAAVSERISPAEEPQSGLSAASERPADSLEDFELISPTQDAIDGVQDAVVPSSSFSRIVNNSFLSSVPVHNIEMPWEQGVAKHIFGDTVFPVESFKVQPLIAGVDLSGKVKCSVDVAGELNHTLGKVEGIRPSGFFSAVSNMTDVAYADKKSLEIETACVKWIAILKLCPGASTLWEHIAEESTEAAWKSNLEVVESIIGVRSPATASSRANVFRKLLEWIFVNHPDESDPLDEKLIWSYFCHLNVSQAAPTSASSAMSALRYAQHIFGFETLSSATGSRRLLGRSELMFSQKDPVRQAVVLTVHDVLTLHSKLNDVESGIFDRIGAGYLLLCLYGRCRHSDLANVNHVVHDHDSSSGFVEIFTRCHKTARGAVKKATFLPILIPVIGINNENWVETLQQLMFECGMVFDGLIGGPVLRPPVSAHSEVLCKRGLTSDECGRLLRILLDLPVERPGKGVPGVTSHSLKATGLSWATKFGLGEYDRAVLGRHSSSTSSASAIYARDLAFPSVKKFEGVLAAIFNKSFRPDAPRSLYFDQVPRVDVPDEVRHSTSAAKPEAELVEIKDEASVVVPSCVGTEFVDSSSDSSGEESEFEVSQEEEPEAVHEPHRKIRKVEGPEASGATWMFHKRSGILHLRDRVESEPGRSSKYFRCGRVVGNNYYPMTDRQSGNPMCSFCNRRS